MKITLTLHCRTQWGQTVFVCFSENERETELVCVSPGMWSAHFADISGTYSYRIKENGKIVSQELDACHSISPIGFEADVWIVDYWKETQPASFLKTSGFRESFFRQDFQNVSVSDKNKMLLFRIESFFLTDSHQIALVGNSAILGNWTAEQALRFIPTAYGEWQLWVEADKLAAETECKLVILDKNSGENLRWQSGENMRLNIASKNGIQVLNLDASEFQKPFKASGVAIPVFSLRSNINYGVGDFPSLKKMVNWAKLTGQKVIQILPINDTTSNHTWRDSYPYNAISIYALHPLYLGLNEFPLKNEAKNLKYRKEGDELNQLQTVDYEKVMVLKTAYIDDLFREIGKTTLRKANYLNFVSKNEDWLFPYACFCCLREVFHSPKPQEWTHFSGYDYGALKMWTESNSSVKKEIEKIYFTQYLLDKQLVEVKEYAHSKGVILKGDIPIGVNPFGADAWTNPHFFNMETQTGAPPDDFAVLGQNWGFPTYNWDEMAKDGYRWWKKRFAKMADYFDAYRIDHILGFFRIWEIPRSAIHGLLGHFSPALPFSKEEIELYGFVFDEKEMTRPCLSEENAKELFGNSASYIFENFVYVENGACYLRDEFAAQRQIETFFADKPQKEEPLKDLLFAFCDEVLFIRDRHQPDKFHPRITAYLSRRFTELSQEQQAAFYRLYEEFYFHRHNDFWKAESLKKLPELLHATGMLACGEDLGMIPTCVPEVMKELNILSLEIERMPKTPYVPFEPLHKLPYLSVCTTSTHDLSPIRLWWKEDKNLTQRYFNEVLWKTGDAPEDCSADLCEQILKNQLDSPAMLVILPLQDWMAMDEEWRNRPENEERINIPADSNHYWQYRMQLTLEELVTKQTINQSILNLVASSNRL